MVLQVSEALDLLQRDQHLSEAKRAEQLLELHTQAAFVFFQVSASQSRHKRVHSHVELVARLVQSWYSVSILCRIWNSVAQ